MLRNNNVSLLQKPGEFYCGVCNKNIGVAENTHKCFTHFANISLGFAKNVAVGVGVSTDTTVAAGTDDIADGSTDDIVEETELL